MACCGGHFGRRVSESECFCFVGGAALGKRDMLDWDRSQVLVTVLELQMEVSKPWQT